MQSQRMNDAAGSSAMEGSSDRSSLAAFSAKTDEGGRPTPVCEDEPASCELHRARYAQSFGPVDTWSDGAVCDWDDGDDENCRCVNCYQEMKESVQCPACRDAGTGAWAHLRGSESRGGIDPCFSEATRPKSCSSASDSYLMRIGDLSLFGPAWLRQHILIALGAGASKLAFKWGGSVHCVPLSSQNFFVFGGQALPGLSLDAKPYKKTFEASKTHGSSITKRFNATLGGGMETCLVFLNDGDLDLVNAALRSSGLESTHSVKEEVSALAVISGGECRMFATCYEELLALFTKVARVAEFNLHHMTMAREEWARISEPAQVFEGQGILTDMSSRLAGATEALGSILGELASSGHAWMSEAFTAVTSLLTAMISAPFEFLREPVKNFAVHMLSEAAYSALEPHINELGAVLKMIVRWAFGYSYAQLGLELLMDSSARDVGSTLFKRFVSASIGCAAFVGQSSGTILGLALTCLLAAVGLTDLPKGAKPSFAKALDLLGRNSRGGEGLAIQIQDAMGWMKDVVLRATYGELYEQDQLFKEWPAFGAAYIMAKGYFSLPNPLHHQKVMLKQALTLYHQEWRGVPVKSQARFAPYLRLLNRAEETVLSLHTVTSRVQPKLFLFVGESGVGKSHLAKFLIEAAHTVYLDRLTAVGVDRSILPERMSDFKYVYSAARAHFDGYKCQPVIQMNELFQFKVGTSIRETEVGAYLYILSNDEFCPPMAHLEDKGIPLITSAAVAASNTYPWEWKRLLQEVASVLAYQRRATNTILVKRKQDVKIVNNVVDHQNREPDEYLDFFYVDPVGGPDVSATKVLFSEIVVDLVKQLLLNPEEAEPAGMAAVVNSARLQIGEPACFLGSKRHSDWHKQILQDYPECGALRSCSGCNCTLLGALQAAASRRGVAAGSEIEMFVSQSRMPIGDVWREFPNQFFNMVATGGEFCRRALIWAADGEVQRAEQVYLRWPKNCSQEDAWTLYHELELNPETLSDLLEGPSARPSLKGKEKLKAQGVGSLFGSLWGAKPEEEKIPDITWVGGKPALREQVYREVFGNILHDQALQAMASRTLSEMWNIYHATGLKQGHQIPIWCSALQYSAMLIGCEHQNFDVLYDRPGCFRPVNDRLNGNVCMMVPVNFPKEVVQELLAEASETFPELGHPAEPFCPLAWLMFRENGNLRWASPADLRVGAALQFSPALARLGDPAALKVSPIERKSYLSLVLGVTAFCAVMAAGTAVAATLLTKALKNHEESWVAQSAELFPPWAKDLSLADRNHLRSILPSTFLYSQDGTNWTNGFALSENTLLLTAHGFKRDQDIVIARGTSRVTIFFEQGYGFSTVSEGDLVMVHLHHKVLAGCRSHFGKAPQSYSARGVGVQGVTVTRQMNSEGSAEVTYYRAVGVASGRADYDGPSGPVSVGHSWKMNYTGHAGQCGSVLLELGNGNHPIKGVHVAGGPTNVSVCAQVSKTLFTNMSRKFIQTRIEVERPEFGFLPHHVDAEKVSRHELVIIGGRRSGPDNSKSRLEPTPLIDCGLEVLYHPTPVENTAPGTVLDPDHVALSKHTACRVKEQDAPFPDQAAYIAMAFQLGVVEGDFLGIKEKLEARGVLMDTPISTSDSARGSDFLSAIDRTTAMGPSKSYLGPTKASRFEPTEYVEYLPETIAEIEEREEKARRGVAAPAAAACGRKDEKDVEYKVDAAAARMFFGVDADEIFTGRKIFYRYLEARHVCGRDIGFAIGLLPAHYQELHEWSLGYTHALPTDVKSQDSSIDLFHLVAFFAYLLGLGMLGNREKKDGAVVHPMLPALDEWGVSMFTLIYRAPLMAYVLFSAVFEEGAGNPSGTLLTWDINVGTNKVAFHWVYCRDLPKDERGCVDVSSTLDFIREVGFVGGGDDAVVLLRGSAPQKFGDGWQEEMLRVGFQMVNPDNKLESPAVKPIPEGLGKSGISFLGRQWVEQPNGLYAGALEKERIHKIFQYCKKGELLKSFPNTFLDALWELKLWGRQYYDEVTALFPEEVRISWEELRSSPRDKLSFKVVRGLSHMAAPKAVKTKEVRARLERAKATAAAFSRVSRYDQDPMLWSKRGEKLYAQSAVGPSTEMLDSMICEADPVDTPVKYDFPSSSDRAGELLKKNYIVASVTWGDSDVGSLWQATGPSFYFNNNFEATKALSNHCYIRGTMVICARVSSTAYDQGSGILWCTPLTGPGPRTSQEAVAHHSVYLNVNAKGCCQLEVPFVRDFKASAVAAYGVATPRFDWFRAGFYVRTPIGARMGASDPTLVIEAWFKDVELIGTTFQQVTLATQGFSESAALAAKSVATEVRRIASGASLEVAKIVVERSAQVLIGALVAGMDKPVQSAAAPFMSVNNYGGANYINSSLPGLVVGDGECCARSAPPGAFGFEHQHLFERYARRPGWVVDLSWSTTHATGKSLPTVSPSNQFACFPGLPWLRTRSISVVTNQGTHTFYQDPPCSYVGRFFQLWRGTMVYTLRAVKTSFHSGSLVVAYAPGFAASSLFNAENNLNRIQNFVKHRWDIDKNPELVVRLPFASPTAMLQRADGTFVFDRVANGHECGGFSVYVETPLRAASEIVQSTIYIEVYAHCEDSTWASPNCNIEEVWRGADYVAPGLREEAEGKGKKKQEVNEIVLEPPVSRRKHREPKEVLLAQAGGDTGELRAEPKYLGIQAVDAEVWTVPFAGEKWSADGAHAAIGSVFSSFLELGKRPTLAQDISLLGNQLNAFPIFAGTLNELVYILATFGWATGDYMVTLLMNEGGTGVGPLRISLYDMEPDGSASAFSVPFSPFVYVENSGIHHIRMQSRGARTLYAQGNALYFDGNRWSNGLQGIELWPTGGAVNGKMCWWWGDNFDIGWQIAPPLARGYDNTAEDWQVLSDITGEY